MQPVATNTAIAAKNRLSCISGGMVVFPSPEHHSDKGYRYQSFRNSPGILAMFAAIRRASSRLSNLTAGNFQQHEPGGARRDDEGPPIARDCDETFSDTSSQIFLQKIRPTQPFLIC